MAFSTRYVTLPLVILNLMLYMIVLGIAGWAVRMAIDTDFSTVSNSGASFYFIIFSLIAGAAGMGAMISGLHHLHAWSLESFSASFAIAVVALVLSLEALGLASKEINSGLFRSDTMKTLEAIVIIVGSTQLFYVISLQVGRVLGEYA